jgi:molybdate-binding protein
MLTNNYLPNFHLVLIIFPTQFKQEFESALTAAKTPSLNIFASHGLAISTLRDLINQQYNFKLDLHFHGRLRSLRALQNGDGDIAGFHIPERSESIARDLFPKYLEMLSPNKHQLLYVVKRNQGLMFQSGNP